MNKQPFYTLQELQDIEDVLAQFIDSNIVVYAEGIDKYYKTPAWFEKIPFLRDFISTAEERLFIDQTICVFLNFCRTHAVPLFLQNLLSEDNYNLHPPKSNNSDQRLE